MKQEIIDFAGLSYPDKRDCGVSQRAKENDHEFNELNELNNPIFSQLKSKEL